MGRQVQSLAALSAQLAKAVVYRDAHVLCIDKWAGLAGQGPKDSLASVLSQLSVEQGDRLRLVHRVETETTGMCLIARTAEAAAVLADAKLKLTYAAVTTGAPYPAKGVVSQPLPLRPSHKATALSEEETARGLAAGTLQKAQTRYNTERACETHAALVELKPLTDHKHQLRMHLAQSLGCPIVGDTVYGPGVSPWMRAALRTKEGGLICGNTVPLLLHCRRIEIPEYRDLFGSDGKGVPRHLDLSWPLPRAFRLVLGRLNIQPPDERSSHIFAARRGPHLRWVKGHAHAKHALRKPLQLKNGHLQHAGSSPVAHEADVALALPETAAASTAQERTAASGHEDAGHTVDRGETSVAVSKAARRAEPAGNIWEATPLTGRPTRSGASNLFARAPKHGQQHQTAARR